MTHSTNKFSGIRQKETMFGYCFEMVGDLFGPAQVFRKS